MRPKALIVDDKENILGLLRTVLGATCDVTASQDGHHALALALAGDFDVVISDIRMPGLDGASLLHELRQQKPDVEVVLMTAYGSVEKAVEAMRAGAFHYLTKPFDPDEALLTVERAVERKRLRTQARTLRAALEEQHRVGELVGKSQKMQQVFELIRRAAASVVPVLVSGETGTGKELAARAIHASSARRNGPFVVINCAANSARGAEPELLVPSRERGTESLGERGDWFAMARGGTLLFDEIGELSPSLQAKLTRAMQEFGAHRSAEAGLVGHEARVIATTKLDLKALAAAGQFRDDLYYRLNVLRIPLPALRERRDDISLLAAHFLERHGRKYSERVEGFTPEGLGALVHYDWPGNVRELENAIEHALAVVDGPRIPIEALPEELHKKVGTGIAAGLSQLSYSEAVDLARDRASREYLIALMREFKGNVARAAERARVERESLHRLLKRYGLRSTEFKPKGTP
jgi:DNA-binding NtrC family response regulator